MFHLVLVLVLLHIHLRDIFVFIEGCICNIVLVIRV
jgi:hypothetical protein